MVWSKQIGGYSYLIWKKIQSIQSSWQITCSLFCFSDSFTRVICVWVSRVVWLLLGEGLPQSLADVSSGGSKPDVQFVNVLMAQADQRFHLPCQSIEWLYNDRSLLLELIMAGPLVAKISGARRKVWILLVVCAATRAVNLQLVSSKGDSTDQDNVHLTGFDSSNEAIGNSLLFPFLLFFSVSVFFLIVSCISLYFSFVIISESAFHVILVFSCVLGWGECRRHLHGNFPSSTHVIFQMHSFSHT